MKEEKIRIVRDVIKWKPDTYAIHLLWEICPPESAWESRVVPISEDTKTLCLLSLPRKFGEAEKVFSENKDKIAKCGELEDSRIISVCLLSALRDIAEERWREPVELFKVSHDLKLYYEKDDIVSLLEEKMFNAAVKTLVDEARGMVRESKKLSDIERMIRE